MLILDPIISSDDLINKLFPNPWEALATFVAFILLIVVVTFVAYKPVKKLLKQRADYVENKIETATKREEESRTIIEKSNKELESAKKEGLRIIEDSKQIALVEKNKIILEGKEEAKLQIENAKKEIEQEVEKNKDKIHEEIVDVAILASKEVLQREINEKDEKRLLDDFVSNLEKDE